MIITWEEEFLIQLGLRCEITHPQHYKI